MPIASRARRNLAAAALLALVVTGCTDSTEDPTPEPTTTSEPAPEPSPSPSSPEPEPTTAEARYGQGVSAAHPLAVQAGTRILAAGGTAVDAAIATAFAVSVVEPFASGIGGGGSAIVAPTGAQPEAYDYREVVAQDGQIPASGTGIPGFVAGMAALHDDHGELPWADLLAPAVELAEGGFQVSDFLALRMRSDYGPDAVQGLDQFAPGGVPLSAGDRLVQPALADSLRAIASGGADAFYTGGLSEQLTTVDGIDGDSLAAYEVVESDPVSGAVGEHEVVSAAPALPGAALIQMLQVAEAAGAGRAEPGSAEYVETVSDAWQVADETAHTVLGDPAFVDVPVEELTDAGANADVAQQVAAPAPDGGAGDGADDGEGSVVAAGHEIEAGNTTHLTVVDRDGLMISMTNTITSFWGAGETVGGFFLNNQLSRFEAIPSSANTPAPGRRSVSWAAPTVVLDGQGRPVLGIGSPGGHQIPNILSNVILRWSLHGQSLEEAVASPRFILDGTLLTTEPQPDPVAADLAALGWTLDVVPVEDAVFGSVQALEVDHETGEVTGTADSRREADVAVEQP
ncbi:gamma-glutamyltransferase family protein [Georgenia alba]|uniref:Gamma-glutamyltransferase family protein n=1 Tax=Georgenia alba TaxID=2233858 RepID=A0ABW2Q603_9MICO